MAFSTYQVNMRLFGTCWTLIWVSAGVTGPLFDFSRSICLVPEQPNHTLPHHLVCFHILLEVKELLSMMESVNMIEVMEMMEVMDVMVLWGGRCRSWI